MKEIRDGENVFPPSSTPLHTEMRERLWNTQVFPRTSSPEDINWDKLNPFLSYNNLNYKKNRILFNKIVMFSQINLVDKVKRTFSHFTQCSAVQLGLAYIGQHITVTGIWTKGELKKKKYKKYFETG